MAIKACCPVNLDIETIIKANPFEKRKGLKKDSLLYIIHCIMTRRASLDDEHLKKLGKSNGYVPLHSKILEKFIPQYHNHIEYLKKVGIIECDGKFIPEKVSMGYRLADQYRGQDFKKATLTDFTLCTKIKAKHTFKINLVKKELPHLVKWIDSQKLQIDEVEAYKAINEYELNEMALINSCSFSSSKKLEEINQLNESCKNFKILVNRINCKDYYCHIDETGKRLHTNLTNIPKWLRKFITYDDQELVSIDIKNSQPYMCTALLKKEFWQSVDTAQKPTLKRISEEMYIEIRKNKKEINNIIKFLDSSKTLTQKDIQKEEFIKNVVNGTFYEYLIPIFEKEGVLTSCKTENEKRDKVKKIVLQLLFDDDNKSYNRKRDSATQIFKRKFPVIAKLFEFIKKDNYRNLAVVLQRIESYLILERVCKRISKENPDLPLFTIHDSIVTTLGNENYVKSVMEDELRKSIGAAPQFSIEYWQKEQDKNKVGAL
ncbi:hypothetical protein LK994_10565 [Ferruginibacter lapsinanis]|uniref:hypothetical protein n=1 Tax=Ferruginibacter lapsinanis TaxID=563172 RepID=UPI001E37FE54|nr:hypothetical protein [Ferruginibacter lapsinanis]UEG49072.1 hypothetical protein LK994_10565 [Ferruginibacter lapsinanis]